MNFEQPDNYKKAAARACCQYSWKASVKLSLMRLSENATFLVTELSESRPRRVMRVSRAGYHTAGEIQAEIEWLERLSRQNQVRTVRPIKNCQGSFLTGAEQAGQKYTCVLFEYLGGIHPDPSGDKTAVEDFRQIGRIAALLHRNAGEWEESRFLARACWDYDHMVGTKGLFGDWRKCGELSPGESRFLEKICFRIRERLWEYGRTDDNYGLIHSDLRAANLLKDEDTMQVIDFDDCGFGWHMYDLAASVSFLEAHPLVTDWIQAWMEGYRTVGVLGGRDIRQIPVFIMARRLQLLAWVTSHQDSDPVKELYGGFAAGTVELARKFEKML